MTTTCHLCKKNLNPSQMKFIFLAVFFQLVAILNREISCELYPSTSVIKSLYSVGNTVKIIAGRWEAF